VGFARREQLAVGSWLADGAGTGLGATAPARPRPRPRPRAPGPCVATEAAATHTAPVPHTAPSAPARVPAPEWLAELPVRPGPPWVSMGVRALDLDRWLVFDENTPAELAEKRRSSAERHDRVFAATPGTAAAGAEVQALVRRWLSRHHPEAAPPDGAGTAPGRPREAVHGLEAAALSVPEDLCLMVERDGTYVLAAAAVHFPSHWRLEEKMGRSLSEIHRPVHHYAAELATKVDTFFTRLTPQRPVVRRNVSVHDHAELFRPEPPEDYGLLDVRAEDLWLRSERQTLVRLPDSGAVLFTIKTQQCPLAAITQAPAVASALATTYRALITELDRSGAALPVPRWLPDWLAAPA